MPEKAQRWLVTGAGGQVGRACLALAGAHGVAAVGVGHAELDVADAVAVKRALEAHRPDVVLNCAAFTAVDRARRKRTPPRAERWRRRCSRRLPRQRAARPPVDHFVRRLGLAPRGRRDPTAFGTAAPSCAARKRCARPGRDLVVRTSGVGRARACVSSNSRRPQFIDDPRGCFIRIIVDPTHPLASILLERERAVVTPRHPFSMILRGDYRHTGLPARGRRLDTELIELGGHQMIGH